MDNSSDFFLRQLKERGYKLTSQRQAVLDCISQHEGEHLTPEEIYEFVKETCPDIGLATVYRTLALLSEMDLIHKLNLDDGYNRYELNKNLHDHRHHHLICNNCGRVIEVEEDLLETLEEQILEKNGFLVTDHRVKFYGLCRDCREKR